MPAPRRHPLVVAVARSLPRPLGPAHRRYLHLLERRLALLAELAQGSPKALVALAPSREERHLAQRFLRPLEGEWDDGDENLVRGLLDRWIGVGEKAERAAAHAVCEGALALARIETRPQVLWFFLWEMESILVGFGPTEPPGGPRPQGRSRRRHRPGR